jgi:hypothetical protein
MFALVRSLNCFSLGFFMTPCQDGSGTGASIHRTIRLDYPGKTTPFCHCAPRRIASRNMRPIIMDLPQIEFALMTKLAPAASLSAK